MMPWLMAVAGLVLLIVAGDLLVRGAVNLSLRLGVPALVVSLTVIAFGTSAPELLISISAVFDGKPGLALGNVVGSNVANVLLVLGLPAILAGLQTRDHDVRESYLAMLAASAVFVTLAFRGDFDLISGVILLGMLATILTWQTLGALKHRREGMATEEDLPEGADPGMRGLWILLFLALGLIGLPIGADLLVRGASIIARDAGVSDTVIGLTLVAIGTSLPELATTVMAALRRQADVALGNVIGSNMFNLLGIIGITALFGDLPVELGLLRFDLWVMLGASLLLIPFVYLKRNITRYTGLGLAALYVLYIGLVLS
ncbi:calcium/sodium antiporter [Pseudooceanicola algae]|uniref:Inner membrane protein YrbG n=1 Tax=Pseudooceanicola algae TaxID=1537215 RepID=A0A418SKI9_9RHOB|nr:calcium/sodium antiporter [Pseudooceanicola algae]QPM90736.1 Inner membrane protein YrbG [Pseudooceanicola algae]